jgi:ribonuclease BN (tRNA processing enzyme)
VKVTLIPSVVDPQGLPLQFLSSCLINDTVAVDAGCVGFYRTPQDQAAVRHVLVSHTHIDHLASLPILVENAYDGRSQGVTVHGSRAVLECLQEDFFNDRIWPDFVAMSRGDTPFLNLSPLEPGDTVVLEGLRVTAVALQHVVPTVGFLVADGQATVAFVSDTGPSEEIWRLCNAAGNVRAVFLEATFPNRLSWLAEVSMHLTPEKFSRELAKLSHPTRAIVVHIKPRFHEEVLAEVRALNLANVEVGQFGVPYEF